MSDKSSDKNVANIEKDIKNIKQYINLVLDKNYCDCNELNVISTGKHCDGSKNVAYSMQNILAELEQKDKRIQELEEENYLQKIVIFEKFIPKQVVIDKIEEIIRETAPTPVFKPKSMWNNIDYERLYKTQPLQELLEGERK